MADYDRQYIKKQIASIVPATPTAGSLQDILSKAAGGNTFDKATDSLEMLSDKVGAYAGTSGAGATESIKAELDLVKAKTDLISGTRYGTTTTGVIVQDGNTGAPSLVSIQAPVNANTFGSWTELDASTSADSWIAGFTIGGLDASPICIEIGTGAALSEAAKIRFSFYSIGGDQMYIPLPIPIKVASGTRIAARASKSTGSGAENYSIGLSMYQSLET